MVTMQINNKVIMSATFIVAFCSIVYELIFAQALTAVFGGSVLRYSITIGLFLFSLGIGSFLYGFFKKIDKKLLFLVIEVLLTLAGFTGVIFILLINSMGTPSETARLILLVSSHIPLVIVGILSGLEIPLLTEFEENNRFAHILGIDYFGSLIGTIIYGLFLYPAYGLIATSFIIGSLNLLVAGLFAWHYMKTQRVARGVFISISLISVCTLFTYHTQIESKVQDIFLSSTIQEQYISYNVPVESISILDILRTPYQQAVVYDVHFADGSSQETDRCLNLDEHVQMCDRWVESYHSGLVDVPMAFFSQETDLDILVLGGGDFIPVHFLQKFDSQINTVDLVDIDAEFQAYAQQTQYLLEKNQSAFEYDKLTIFVQDAFDYLRHSSQQYDLILVDLPGIQHDKLLPLYSVEFFTFLQHRLKEDGLAVSWKYPRDIYPAHASVYETTLRGAGFTDKLEYYAINDIDGTLQETESFIVLAHSSEREIDTTSNTYVEKYQTFLEVPWEEVVAIAGVRSNSIFRPNYDIIVNEQEQQGNMRDL